MWIKCNRVSFLTTLHNRALASLREDEEATPACINMMPNAILFANCRYFILVIKATHDGRTQDAIDEEWLISLINFGLNCFVKSFSVKITGLSITWNLDHVVHTHATNHGSSVN